MFNYRRADQVNYDFINDVLRVDAEVYNKDLQGTYESVRARFNANKESYILAYRGIELVGYVCFFPISQSLSQRIRDGMDCFDDNIKSEDILPDYGQGEKDVDVFLISIALSKQFRDKGIGTRLMEELFAFLSEKIQQGCKIRNAYSYAYTSAGSTVLNKFGFADEKRLSDSRSNDPVYLMKYTFDNFEQVNMYMFVPFSVDEQHGKFIKSNPDKRGIPYKTQLERVSKNEFCAPLMKKLTREFVSRERFIVVDDEDKDILTSLECDIYVTFYKNNYVATLVFDSIGLDPTAILNQASINRLYIDGATENGSKQIKIPFFEYLAAKFELEANCVKDAGEIRTFTSLVRMPPQIHLMHMLACESYIKGYVNTHLTSSYFYEKSLRNIAQYDFSKIFVSGHNVVYVLKDPENDRFGYESLMIFIMELLSLQLSAINASYDEIINAMASTKFDYATIERVNMRFSKGAVLWDINNFIYPAAQYLFETISAEFGLPRIKEEHRNNLSVFEKLTAMKTQKDLKKQSQSTQTYFMIFSLLSAIGTLGSIVGLVMKTSDGVFEAIITLILGCITTSCFIITFILSRRNIIFKPFCKKKKKKK